MVLATRMKATFFILCGALLGVVAGLLGSAAYGYFFSTAHPLNDESSNMLAVVLVFGILPASALAGALAGYALHRRRLYLSRSA